MPRPPASSDPPDDPLKVRLFGEARDEDFHKQVIKARFLRELQPRTPDDGGRSGASDPDDSERSPTTDPDPAPEVPVRIGPYTILRKLGQGGMGVVYLGYDDELDRKVAIKLLRTGRTEADGRGRMLREGQALARLSHPHVVQVHAIGEWSGHDYVAMEYVEGQTLDRWLGAAPRGWREVLDLMIDAGAGLEAAHAAGLIHRDFKPANLLIGRDDRIRVLDFGLARLIGEVEASGRPPGSSGSSGEGDTPRGRGRTGRNNSNSVTTEGRSDRLTATGAVLGTPAYMAPEQYLGQPATELSDQFSFCVVLYEGLWGRRPFAADDRGELAQLGADARVDAPLVGTGVPPWLRKAVLRGLSVEADQRWKSMTPLLAELRRDHGRARKAGLVVGGVALAIATGLAVRHQPDSEPVCARDPSSIADTWGPEPRAAMAAAFTATGIEEAPVVLDHATGRLQAYADEIVRARADACAARWVERSQTDTQLQLRGACLDQRERELAAVVGTLVDADREVVLHTSDLLAGLGEVSVCAQPDLLALGTPAPKDSSTITAIAEVEAMIAEADAARRVGRIAESEHLTQAAWAAAEPLDFPPLRGRLHYLAGNNASTGRRDVEAQEHWIEAVAIAQRHQDFELAAEAWIKLAFVSTGATAPNLRLEFKLANAAVERLGGPVPYLIELDVAEGSRLLALGQSSAALAAYDRALTRVDASTEQGEAMVGRVWAGRSEALANLGRIAEARADLDRLTSAQGVQGRRQLDALFDLAVIELQSGDLDGGERDMAEALRGYEALFGPRFESIAHGNLAIVNIALAREDLATADVAIAKALEILDEDHADRDWGLDALASVRDGHGDKEGAVAALRAALAHRVRVGPSEHARIGYLHLRIGVMLIQGQPDDEALDAAHAEFEHALAELDRPDVEEPLDLAAALKGLGETLLRRGQLEAAQGALERAVELAGVDCGEARLAGDSRVLLALVLQGLDVRRADQVELATVGLGLLEDFASSADMVAAARRVIDSTR